METSFSKTSPLNNEQFVYESPNRLKQIITIFLTIIFILGFFFSPVGIWTGVILGAWFIGTQKAWRGFLWLVVINYVLTIISNLQGSFQVELEFAGRMILTVLITTLPFLFYRITIQNRQNFLSTLSLPFWGVAMQELCLQIYPANTFLPCSFLIYWFGAIIHWMWNHGSGNRKLNQAVAILISGCLLGAGLYMQNINLVGPLVWLSSISFAWICLVGGSLVTAWSILMPEFRKVEWSSKPETLSILQSPYTAESLNLISEKGQEALVSKSGEHFSIRSGIPIFFDHKKITGSNEKYNHLYQIIGGFYDDVQRVACALRGVKVDSYFWVYLRFLEINPGDKVLETSVGTGLNFKYLPRDLKLFGLDLSSEMLTNCQVNLRRWKLDADLFLGNAEELPFADNSFDVVFHSGGINFFNDIPKAINEMIRVAKPGSRILIADETEEYVKSMYERSPVSRQFFKDRNEEVKAPIDLVPKEMQEIHLEMLLSGKFYALTFRKPS